MAYVITDECVSCGSCAAECPSEAISEGADHFEIDADACVEDVYKRQTQGTSQYLRYP